MAALASYAAFIQKTLVPVLAENATPAAAGRAAIVAHAAAREKWVTVCRHEAEQLEEAGVPLEHRPPPPLSRGWRTLRRPLCVTA